MEIRYYKEYSKYLQREMEFKVYGKTGKPCLVIPSQNGRFYDFENFGMIEECQSFIEKGALQIFCVDTIDAETLSAIGSPIRERMEQHEKWFWYICDEFYQRMMEINHETTPREQWKMPFVAGCSMGGYHSANIFFRKPDQFDTVISLSGFYHLQMILGDYIDDLVYLNSPYDSILNLPKEHPYRKLYKRSNIILCVGQGEWEQELLQDTREFEQLLQKQQIDAWVDYWGMDVSHDWSWWRKQWVYFLSYVVAEDGKMR